MSQISAEKKLELIRVIRSEQAQNKQLLRTREEIITPKAETGISGTKVRTYIALFIMASVLCMEFMNLPALKAPLNTLYTEISKDGNLFDFVEDLTYTLKDD